MAIMDTSDHDNTKWYTKTDDGRLTASPYIAASLEACIAMFNTNNGIKTTAVEIRVKKVVDNSIVHEDVK